MIEIIPNLHPIFVHFTVALLSVSIALFILSHLLKHKPYVQIILNTAYVNLWLGVLITVVTVAMGFYAYYTVAHDAPSHLAMTDHRNWALITFSIFLIVFIWSILNYRKKTHYNIAFIIVLIIAAAFLMTTAYKGGEVVYRYGIGVKSLPETHGDGGHDSHSHGDEAKQEKINDSKMNGSDHHGKDKKKTHDHSTHKH